MKDDPRLNPGKHDFGEGTLCSIGVPLASVHRRPAAGAMQLTQALMGEAVRVFDNREGWAWCQLVRDGYVGYIRDSDLSSDATAPTHRIWAPSTFMYPAADLKTQPATVVPMNAAVVVTELGEKYARLAGGAYIFSRHLKPINERETDFVAIAEQFLHVPYLWGGKSVIGIDCSGLVQVSLEACGIPSRRDSDMQEEEFGEAIRLNSLDGMRRGDLVFWKGHVGIMTDAETLLHANGAYMQVVREPLRLAVERIAAADGQITSIRRRQ